MQSSVLQIIALIIGKYLVNISCINILLTSFFSLTFANSIFANKKDDVVENSFAFSSPMDIWCRE